MRFVLFSAQYLPTVGGVERYTHNLAQTLAGMGHTVLVVTSALPGQPAQQTQPDGTQVLRLPSFLWLKGRFPVLKPGAAGRKQAALLWQQTFDFALINTRFYPLSLFAANFCKKQGIPAAVLEHGTAHLSMGNPVLNTLGNWYEHWAIGYIRRRCKAFYGVSGASASWLQHFGIKAKGVLYNAVNPTVLQTLASSSLCNFRQQYGLLPSAPVVVYSGRFIPEKGIFELLDAFAQLHKTMPEVTLIMAGDGPCLDEVKARNQAGVVCTGMLPHNQSLALLSQATVFCLPSYSEGFSTVILEVAALKTAIVTTPTGGSPELIGDGKAGILLQNLQPDTIAAALQKALCEPAWRSQAEEKAYQTLTQRFTWQKTAEALVEIATKNPSGEGKGA
ncbi:glycosyltransferase family 4 protein [Ruminococcaceae bacterium OttesenSCG-928-A16]|nr:glycosyltransferase family 4 protein [Ruminococcaceae bacterium OttesenSCG-928-A16]